MDAVTVSRLVSEHQVRGQFPDTEQLNADRASSLCCSLLAFHLLHCLPHHSISFHLSWLSLTLHHGTSKWFNSLTLLSPPVPLQFLAFCLRSIHLSLAMHLNGLSSSLSLCLCLLLHPPVQTSVSKRLTLVCCAKPSAQIWITAVWRCVCDNSYSLSLLAWLPTTCV